MSHTHKFTIFDLTQELRAKIRQGEQKKTTLKLCKQILIELEILDRKYRAWKRNHPNMATS